MSNVSTSAAAGDEAADNEDPQEQLPEVSEHFCVRDAATAAWVVRKVVEARAHGCRVRAWAARELRRSEHEERFFLYRYGRQLEEWTRRQLQAENGRRKSINLPSGSVGFRTDPQRLEVTDEDALLRWCKSHLPAAVVTAEQVLRGVVKDCIRETGELPEGAEVAGGEERFFVK